MVMERIVLCTGNPGKVAELRALLPPTIELLSLAEVGLPSDLPETGDTLETNALQKARYAHALVKLPCMADDTGLEVDALNGAPGVSSARYAGEAKDAAANMARLLRELEGRTDRNARFRTVIAYIDQDGEHTFEGTAMGRIALERRGTAGFGYDPIFIPDGSSFRFAEMTAEAKNAISHRARALQALLVYLSGRSTTGQ